MSEPNARAFTTRAESPMPLIDCDLHPLVPHAALLSRMSTRARRDMQIGDHPAGAIREHNRLLHPTGTLRQDAVPPGGGSPGSDPAFAVQHWLDPENIVGALVVPIQAAAVIPLANAAVEEEFLRGLNDYLLEEWYGCDKRYRIAISVSPRDAGAAVREIERIANRPGVTAINIPLAEVSLGSERFERLFEAAAHHKLPVMMHPTGAEGNAVSGPSLAGGVGRTYPEHHSKMLLSGQAAVAAVTLSGALARNPDLRIVVSEYGFSWAPALMARMDRMWQQNDADATLKRRPSEYLLEQVRFTSQPFDEPANPRNLWPLLDAMDAARTLLFSSDYPHWDTDNPTLIFRTRVPTHLRERVAFASAQECFGERLWH